ncbi:MAG: diaminopimelate decarboxylase [Xanthomonadales bacterium]
MESRFHERVLRAAIDRGLLGDETPLAAFVVTTAVEETVDRLQRAFPPHFEHMFAAKANTMRRALELVRACGMGCEVASPGELEQAIRAGFETRRIVVDEPAKTLSTLRRVLELGVDLNIDSFQEFERVRAMAERVEPRSSIGFRINPQVGAGRIDAMSTGSSSSKFGVGLEDPGNRTALIACYRDHPWLNAVHVHVGSQGCSLDLMTDGIAKTAALAEEINDTLGHRQVDMIDIGGGLPVNFDSEAVTPTFAEYAALLRERVPVLFDGAYRVRTEFGRAIYAKNGFIASRIEYTKQSGGRQIAIGHAGVQVATRTVFMPEHWSIRISGHDGAGRRKTGPDVTQDVAGPCCFAGDLAGRAVQMPLLEPGDYVVLHDTGAYYFSNPFFYNALAAPPVYGAQLEGDGLVQFDCWRRMQSLENMLAVIG